MLNNSMHSRKHWVLIVLLYVSLPIFLMATDPYSLPLPLLLIPSILVFLILFHFSRMVLSRLNPQANRRFRLVVAGSIAGTPAVLLLLQSVHQLSLLDVVIVIALLVGSLFYISKADFIQS
jgi:choline-glycine betaine transporter